MNKSTRNKQKGFTLTEVLLATVVTGSAMAAAYQWMQRSQDDTNLTIAAQHHKMVMEAGAEYIKDHQATVLAGSTATSPYKITVAMLIAAKKLPDGFNPVNNFGQTQCVLVLQPATNNPVQLTVSEGGTELSDFQLARAVGEVGASGGGIYAATPAEATGADGSWKITGSTTPKLADFLSANCSGTTAAKGHFASTSFYSSTTQASRYLQKSNDPGRYDQTAMSDPLGLAVKTADSACDGTNEKGRLAIDSNQQLLLCQNIGGWKWKALTGYLKDPVANYASLPAAGNSSGDVRKTLDNQRHFTWNGASWIALAVDQNGNFAVPGALTVNGSKMVGDGGTNTWIQQSGKLNVTDSAGTYTDLQANDVTATGRTTSNDILVNSTVTEGTACTPNGLIARSGTGLILSCQSGVWNKASGGGLGNTCAWYGPGWLGDSRYHTVSCPAGTYANGWRGYASTYMDDNFSLYCCS